MVVVSPEDGVTVLTAWKWVGGWGVIVGVLLSCSRAPTSATQAVILYCAQDQVFAEPILAEFTRQTGIPVKSVFDSEAVKTVGLANRLLAERQNPVCDVFWGNEELRTRQLVAAGVFLETNGWAAFGQRSRRMVFNTNQVRDVRTQVPADLSERSNSRVDAPTSLLDLTNSPWRGKVSLAFPLFGTTATHFLALRQRWGESNWLSWCRALAANQPFLEEGNSQVVKRVARGEALIGLTDSDDITAGQREGLPVAAGPIGPESLLIPNTVALVAKDGGIRPEAQRLFEYLQEPSAQVALIRAGALEPEVETQSLELLDWNRLVQELDVGVAQLQDVFRR